MAKKYLLYIHDEKFEKEAKKSTLVNSLLAKHYGGTPSIVGKKPRKSVEALLEVPGVIRASEARCKGTHYMSRMDCGRIGCPWGRRA